MLSQRKCLPHAPPPWVPDDAIYFITICCSHRGHNTLARPQVAKALFDSIDYREKLLHWKVHLALLMPDHLHAFIVFSPFQSIKKTIKDWKRYTARTLKIDWQDDYFEHRIRNKAELDEKWSYILNNPIRSRLCELPNDWPFKR